MSSMIDSLQVIIDGKVYDVVRVSKEEYEGMYGPNVSPDFDYKYLITLKDSDGRYSCYHSFVTNDKVIVDETGGYYSTVTFMDACKYMALLMNE